MANCASTIALNESTTVNPVVSRWPVANTAVRVVAATKSAADDVSLPIADASTSLKPEPAPTTPIEVASSVAPEERKDSFAELLRRDREWTDGLLRGVALLAARTPCGAVLS